MPLTWHICHLVTRGQYHLNRRIHAQKILPLQIYGTYNEGERPGYKEGFYFEQSSILIT